MVHGAAAHAAVVAQATKATGAIVRIDPHDFQSLLGRMKEPLVVHSFAGVFSKKHEYLMNYKGIFFFTKSEQEIHLPSGAELVEAKQIWIPM